MTTVFRMTPAFKMSPSDIEIRVYNEVKAAQALTEIFWHPYMQKLKFQIMK